MALTGTLHSIRSYTHDRPFRSHARINEFTDSDLHVWLTAINAASVLLVLPNANYQLSGGSDKSTHTTSFIATVPCQMPFYWESTASPVLCRFWFEPYHTAH